MSQESYLMNHFGNLQQSNWAHKVFKLLRVTALAVLFLSSKTGTARRQERFMRTSRLVVLGLCVLTVLEIAPTSLPIRAAAVQAKGAVEGMATFTPPKMPSPTSPAIGSAPTSPDLAYVTSSVTAGTLSPAPVNPSPSTSLTPRQGNISNRPPMVSAGNNS